MDIFLTTIEEVSLNREKKKTPKQNTRELASSLAI